MHGGDPYPVDASLVVGDGDVGVAQRLADGLDELSGAGGDTDRVWLNALVQPGPHPLDQRLELAVAAGMRGQRPGLPPRVTER